VRLSWVSLLASPDTYVTSTRRKPPHATRPEPRDRQYAKAQGDYLEGVASTLAWVLGDQFDGPITRPRPREVTTRDLKQERVHAQDVIEQTTNIGTTGRFLSCPYGEGIKVTVSWFSVTRPQRPWTVTRTAPSKLWAYKCAARIVPRPRRRLSLRDCWVSTAIRSVVTC
jgi:hypothetical protein